MKSDLHFTGTWAACAVFLLLLPPAAPAATLDVCASGCTYSSIQAALDASASGDVIEVADGTYVENINFPNKSVTVTSVNGAALTVIDGNHAGPAVSFISGGNSMALEGFTITGGLRGIYLANGSSPSVTDCLISGNTDSGSERGGGGVVCVGSSSPTFRDCVISNNSAGYGNGGGVSYGTTGTSPTFVNCAIRGNTSVGEGGGVHGTYGSATFFNCTITGNTASQGGGVGCWISSARLVNCTVSGNNAAQGGALYCYRTAGSPPVLLNTILWGNSVAGSGNEIHFDGDCAVIINYSNIQGGWAGTGNIDADPSFVTPLAFYFAPDTGGDFHLKKGSPCINGGTSESAPDFDMDLDPRPQRGEFDIGADEYPSLPADNLLANASFESGYPLPEGWTATKTGPRDACVTGTSFHAVRSFRLRGASRRKALRQEITLSGGAGETFILTGWSRAKDPLADGGPYRLEARVFHDDGSRAVYRTGFSKKTHKWQSRSRIFTTEKDYGKIVVVIRYANQAGTAWFDALSLTGE